VHAATAAKLHLRGQSIEIDFIARVDRVNPMGKTPARRFFAGCASTR
jgi:hypothetical protein